MADQLKPGDHVTWSSSQGEIRGTVEAKVTDAESVKGHVARASRRSPQYKVRSDKTGAEAIHKPDALTRK